MSNPQKGSPFIVTVVVAAVVGLIAVVIALGIFLPAPSDDDGVYRAVRALGFTAPTIIARHGGQTAAWQQGCDEGTMSACDVRVLNDYGRPVTLLVCCGGAANRSCSVRAK